MSKGIDSIVALLKWPVAVVSLVLLPGLFLSLFNVLRVISHSPRPVYPFVAGAAAYAVLWAVYLRRPSRAAFTTLEHELTHALFAWATFHRVVGVGATLRSGGHIRYVGKGNWLIAIAPFFFPTFSLLLVVVLGLVPVRYLAFGSAALGVTFAYHILSTWPAAHRHHSDLREVGFLFRIIFLPATNALVYALVLSSACGLRPLTAFLRHVPAPTVAFVRWLLSLF